MEARAIFLDINGVLNCDPSVSDEKDKYGNMYEPYVKNLSRIYHKYNNTKIILPSNWKKIFNMNQLQDIMNIFKKYDIFIDDCFIDKNSYSKPEGIKEYLKSHPDIKYWVSLDDDYSYEAYENVEDGFSKHLCKTLYCGLNNIKTHVALEIIGGELD
jgi:hypothetical protein